MPIPPCIIVYRIGGHDILHTETQVVTPRCTGGSEISPWHHCLPSHTSSEGHDDAATYQARSHRLRVGQGRPCEHQWWFELAGAVGESRYDDDYDTRTTWSWSETVDVEVECKFCDQVPCICPDPQPDWDSDEDRLEALAWQSRTHITSARR